MTFHAVDKYMLNKYHSKKIIPAKIEYKIAELINYWQMKQKERTNICSTSKF